MRNVMTAERQNRLNTKGARKIAYDKATANQLRQSERNQIARHADRIATHKALLAAQG